jgi:hypothetical protein
MRSVKGAAAALGALLQRLDGVLRTWAIAGLSLLILLLVLAGALLLDS